MAALIRECTEKCRSSHHVNLCISALTKCTDEQFKQLAQLCSNTLTSSSSDGRTALHLAASMGKTELIEWMAEQDNTVKFTTPDVESNWTALHRALFYGHLTTARLLIAAEPSCSFSLDNEGRTPLDLVVADRRHQLFSSPRNELYSWGENVNFTLGRPSEQARLSPEVVGMSDVSGVSDVVMCKYHTLVLTSNGQVLSCGHGWGGRLGHGTEATVLTPKSISSLKNENVVAIAAAKDHSVFLTGNNSLFTCGLNEHHQLGQEGGKILQPKTVKHKLFREHSFRGVCAGRFHTAVWASDALFTFGLNAGQLGHHHGDTYQIIPRLVSGIQYKTMSLDKVVSSDAAILCFTKQGDLILIHEFRIRKIAANWTIEKISLFGGKLDHRNDLEALKELGGCEVSIGVMNSSQQIFLWRQSDPSLRRVNYSGCPWLSPRDFQMSKSCLLIASIDGQVFTATLPAERRKFGGKKKKDPAKDSLVSDFKAISLGELCRGDETCYVELNRVRGIHRALSVYMDFNAHNFMSVQSLPNENLTLVPEVSPSEMTSHVRQLYSETRTDDVIHDVELESKNLSLPAHQFVLSSGCAYFQTLFRGENAGELVRVDVSELGNADLIVQMIQFIYTGTCDLVVPGTKFKFTLEPIDQVTAAKNGVNSSNKGRKTKGKSAYSVHKSNIMENVLDNSNVTVDVNPVRMLKEMAKSLGVKGLLEKLDNISWQDGKVCLKDKSKKSRDFIHSFNRRKMSHLFDIKLESEDGEIFNCHKCILIARLEYFHSMLTCGWLETEMSENVTLPVIGPIFQAIVQYLYTDDSPDLRSSTDVEFMCNVLVAADQLLVTRLKEICEVVICQHLSLKNVAEIIEFASLYNAPQLKMACQQFICLNLTALLEARSLDIVGDDVMDDVSEFYRMWIPSMCRRRITPYDEPPYSDDLENLMTSSIEVEESKSEGSITKPKSRRRRSKTLSESKRDSFSEVIVDIASPEASPNVSMTEAMGEPKSPKSPAVEESTAPKSPAAKPTWPRSTSKTPTSPTATTWPSDSPTATWPVTSCGDVLGLRGIMEEESHRSRDQGNDRNALGGKKKKLSQKERKRLAQETETAKPEHETAAPPASPSSCPWAQVSKPLSPWAAASSTPAPSFRDLMLNDQQSDSKSQTAQMKMKIKTPQKSSKINNISWGLPQRGRGDSKLEPEPEPPSPSREPTNPWSPLSTDKNTSFTEIVQEEISEEVTLDRTRRKPLHLIQTEEQAICELMAFYKSSNPPDVKITVERMTKAAAVPTWAAKQ